MSLDLMRLALIADFEPAFPPHVATEAAVRHAADALGISAQPMWVPTAELAEVAAARLAGIAGVWIAPGSPYRSLSGALAAIRFARERDVPLLGTCGGFQHVVIEYARNVLGIEDAGHEEYLASSTERPHPGPHPKGEGAEPRLFISRLACSLVGRTMQVRLQAGSRVAGARGSLTAEEQYYCNFAINPEVIETLFGIDRSADQRSGCGSAGASPSHASTTTQAWDVAPGSPRTLTITGADQDGEPRVIELPDHPFFVATLYVPQMRSHAGKPHPLVLAWLAAAARRTVF